jgi:hypothetical protein
LVLVLVAWQLQLDLLARDMPLKYMKLVATLAESVEQSGSMAMRLILDHRF